MVAASAGHVLVREGSQSVELVDFRIYGSDIRWHQELMLKALHLALREVTAHVRARHAHHLPSHLAPTSIGRHERLLWCRLLELQVRLICHVVVSHAIPIAVVAVSARARVLPVLVEA